MNAIFKNENIQVKFLIFLCFVLPVFAPIVLYAFQPKSLFPRSRFIVWQLLNKQVSMSIVYYVLLTGLLKAMAASRQFNVYRVLLVIFVFFIASFIKQVIYSRKWLNGELKEYKYILKFFSKF